MATLRAKLLVRITVAILLVEAVLLVVSIEVRRRELIARHHDRNLPHARYDAADDEQMAIHRELRAYAGRIGAAIVVVVIGTVGLVYFALDPLVLRPVHRIVRANREISLGRHDGEISETEMPNDELGEIMRTRAQMLASLKETQTYIETMNKSLEARVAERTTTLERILEQLRQSQRHLLKSEKMSTLGVVAAGLAHDVVQPLTSTALLLHDIKKQVRDPRTCELIAQIRNQLDAVTRIVDNVRRFSREPRPPRAMSLNPVLERSVSLVAKSFELSGIRLNTHWASRLPLIQGDEVLIEQMVLNLLNNARDAVIELRPSGGEKRIRVETRSRTGKVELVIEDNGHGMTTEIKGRIFDLFFTTKQAEKGTGLGLAMVKDIVARLGASIDCISQPGAGTTFILSFQTARDPMPVDDSRMSCV